MRQRSNAQVFVLLVGMRTEKLGTKAYLYAKAAAANHILFARTQSTTLLSSNGNHEVDSDSSAYMDHGSFRNLSYHSVYVAVYSLDIGGIVMELSCNCREFSSILYRCIHVFSHCCSRSSLPIVVKTPFCCYFYMIWKLNGKWVRTGKFELVWWLAMSFFWVGMN
ncbi:hypothetical protein Nepgr_006038 [Nepenthes gracilis]|uniref:Uncharacterized protein n=1 Tax=Nepenthes gracilis TaxID=150966 RepID=A0AAD3XGY9_NEPGR|nr:hypothetical protein Nepgr_006038 [Nepenthes gracilis]